MLRSLGRGVARLMPWNVAYPILRGPLRGARFVLGAAAGRGGGASIYLDLSEQRQLAALASALRPGQLFFDVGANVGHYTLLGSRRVGPMGRVVAFEPVPRNVAYLHRHVALNRADNVRIVPAACADRGGLERFLVGENHALGGLGAGSSRTGFAMTVLTLTIDDYVGMDGAAPDVIKIDVEGGELRVLQGAARTLSRRPVVFLSTHSDALRASCLDLLAGHGYRSEELDDRRSEFCCRAASA